MGYVEEVKTKTVTLTNGQKLSAADSHIEVSTKNADRVHVYLDDGTAGNTPATYDIEHFVFKMVVNDWMFDHESLGETARSWSVPATGSKWRIDLTNKSGANATYRIVVESRVED